MYVLLAVTLALLGGLTTTLAQDECQALTYCGTFCCPNSADGDNNHECCRDSKSCCKIGAANATSNVICGNRQCPKGLPTAEVYDTDFQIRDQCCQYFRSGCCSQKENQVLDLLYKLAIGLGAGIGLLLIIIGILVICCLFWFCCG